VIRRFVPNHPLPDPTANRRRPMPTSHDANQGQPTRGRARLGVVVALALAALALAEQPPPRAVEPPIEFTTGQDDNLFSVVRLQEQIHAYEQGLEEVAAGDVRAGVERLHRVLQADATGVVPVAPGRFLGLRLAVTLALANLSPAAKAAYEELVEREGGVAADLTQLDDAALRQLADRFPAAAIGRRARLRLGDLALVAGDARGACGHFRQAFDGAAIGSDDERRAAERLYCAGVLLDPVAAAADRAVGALSAAGEDALGALPAAATAQRTWPSVAGAGSGRPAMPEPPRHFDTRWSAEVVAPGFDTREISQFAMQAVGDLDAVYVNTGHQVVAFDPLRKEALWATIAPMRAAENEPASVPGFGRRQRRSSDDGVNEDSTLAAALGDDVVVAALQVPEKSVNVDFQGGLRVISKIPMRRLHAFARSTGNALWTHYDELDGPRTRRFRGHDACGAPLVADGVVYAPVHDRAGAIAFSIAAYDLRTGEMRWRRLVCSGQQDVNMFGNARAEFAASPLALRDGVLYGASNLGVAFAVEAATGRLRWLSSYEVVRMPLVGWHQQPERPVFFANNAPAVTASVVCLTPLDSQFVLGLDAENGRTLWRVPAQATVDGVDHRVFWIAGSWPDEFVLAGAGAIAVTARSGGSAAHSPQLRAIVDPSELDERGGSALSPRPALCPNSIWFARTDGLRGFDRQGKAVPGSPVGLGRFAFGNLLSDGGLVVSLRQGAIDFAYDALALRGRVEAAAKANPDDPSLLLRLASLRRALLPADADADQRAAVQQAYQNGLDAAVRRGLPADHPVRQALQRELFAQAGASAQAAANAGAPTALALTIAARDLAPDDAQWALVHAAVLDAVRRDGARFTAELDRLLARMPDGAFPRLAFPLPRDRTFDADDVTPVRAFVAWQKAAAQANPAAAIAGWQELLEMHSDAPLVGGSGADVARKAIDDLLRQHGRGCYAAVEARAAAASTAAGDDRAALAACVARFPNSAAAAAARVRLLDAGVKAGDLAFAAEVLAAAIAQGEPSPGLLRRVQVAAATRGNQAIAAAMAARLRRHADTASDWPDDGKRPYRDVALASPPLAPTPAVAPPAQDLALLRPPPGADFLLLAPTIVVDGFNASADALLYCRAENELLAIDARAAIDPKPVRFALSISYVEHLLLCGTTLVVPDMDAVAGFDCRTGARRWQLANPQRRLLESLGVQQGVLLVTAMPRSGEGAGELMGVEPLTGAVLFRRAVPTDELKPKAVDGGVLCMAISREGDAIVRRLDPISGAVTTTWTIQVAALKHVQLDGGSLSSRFDPQSLLAHGDLLLLPVDRSLSGDAARIVAVAADGRIAWRWQGPPGSQLQMAALHGDTLALLSTTATGAAQALALDAATGAVRRTVDAGFDATPHNWERGWIDAPAPALLAIESWADADRTERQLLVVGVATGAPTFALPLGREDGDLIASPVLGPDFLAFATRPARGNGGSRLWAVSLTDRSGMLANGRRQRPLPAIGNVDEMLRVGDAIAISGARGVLLLGSERGPR